MSHPGHPDTAATSRLLAALGRDRATLKHLLDCRLCRVRLRPTVEAGNDAIWERLEESILDRARELVQAPEETREWKTEGRLAELLALPAKERRRAVERDERFQSSALAGQLLETGRSAGRADPAAGRERFHLALALIGRLDPEGAGRETAAGLLARAHSYLAESLALAGDRNGAEAAFQRAARHLETAADPLDRAWFCHLLSRLRAEEGRSDEAAALARRAATLFAAAGQASQAAAALLDEIRLLLQGLDPERALDRLFAALCAPG